MRSAGRRIGLLDCVRKARVKGAGSLPLGAPACLVGCLFEGSDTLRMSGVSNYHVRKRWWADVDDIIAACADGSPAAITLTETFDRA